MATGYTDAIGKGISFEEFVCNCARAFGACVTMRDESMKAPLPDEFKASDYHAKRIEEAKNTLYDVERMTTSECRAAAEKEWEENEAYRTKILAERAELRKKYEAMLAKVKAWKPPSKDHEGLTDFMVQQITDSIKWDCDNDYYAKPSKKLTAAEWKKKSIETAKHDIEYHKKEDDEERERAKDRSEWVRQLKESLGVKPNGVVF